MNRVVRSLPRSQVVTRSVYWVDSKGQVSEEMVVARQVEISKLLRGPARLLIPRYQRRYSWQKAQWGQLWDDLERLADERRRTPSERHFFGSIVLLNKPGTRSGDLLVVDGQQRIITLSLLMRAISNSLLASADKGVRKRLDNCLIRRASNPRRHVIVPTDGDLEVFKRIILGYKSEDEGPITDAYEYFKQRILELGSVNGGSHEPIRLEEFARATLTGLQCVRISTSDGDNPYRIFETLNNRGMGLEQSELIKNYIFMRMGGRSEDFYQNEWKRLEDKFSADQLNLLFWIDLVLENPTIKQSETYVGQERKLGGVSSANLEKRLQGGVLSRSQSLELILNPDKETSSKIKKRLERLHAWGSSTTHPLVMYLLERRAGSTPESEVTRALLYLESYLVRRIILGLGTMNVNRILLAAPVWLEKQTSGQSLGEDLGRYLAGSEQKLWATDAQVRQAVREMPFYKQGRANQRRLILTWIDAALGDNDAVIPDGLSIEHILPVSYGKHWSADLKAFTGAEIKEVRDTIGNLTLVLPERNSSLSHKSFAEKKEQLKKTHLLLNKSVTPKHTWTPKQIQQRSDLLAEVIVRAWPGPRPAWLASG